MGKSDEEIIDATMGELARLFPTEIAADPAWPKTLGTRVAQGQELAENVDGAKLRKFAVVRTPRSVYAAVPGRNKYRPSQKTPVPNLTLCGCFTSQKFLGSMEGAVLAGKLAAEVVAARAAGAEAPGLKPVQDHILQATSEPVDPVGCRGDSPIAFGGGTTFNDLRRKELQLQDPAQLQEVAVAR